MDPHDVSQVTRRTLQPSGTTRAGLPQPELPLPLASRLKTCFLLALLFLLHLLLSDAVLPVAAQSQASNYWQYPAAGRLHHVIASDVNQDGIDEILVVDDKGKVDLLSSRGVLQWSYNTRETVVDIMAADIRTNSQPGLEIVVATQNRLILLTVNGTELWQTVVTPFLSPLSLLTSGEDGAQGFELSSQPESPLAIRPFDHNHDGEQEILVLLESGQLRLYNGDNTPVWNFSQINNPGSDTFPLMAVGDLDGDGQEEAALGVFNPQLRFSQLTIVDGQGEAIWSQPQSVSGRISALTLVAFGAPNQQYIGVGNNLGQINLYDVSRRRLWQRTLNKPITSMAGAYLQSGPGLVAGTIVGSVTGFDLEGRRSWTRYLDPDAERSILAFSAVPFEPLEGQPSMSVIIEPAAVEDDPADVVLLTSSGRDLDTLTGVDTATLTQLTDINRDQRSELLLARFAQVQLSGLGLGASETAKGWDYNLFSEPRSLLVTDLDRDGSDELIIGTEDGRIHSLNNNNSIRWLHAPGGAVTHLAALEISPSALPSIVAVRNDTLLGLGNVLTNIGWLELRQANGKQLWEQQKASRITALAVGDVEADGRPEIIVGSETGDVSVYDTNGRLLWETAVTGSVEHLLVLDASGSQFPALIASSMTQLFRLSQHTSPWRIAAYDKAIHNIYPSSQPGSIQNDSILLILEDGTVRSHVAWRGPHRPQWLVNLGSRPVASISAAEVVEPGLEPSATRSLIIATDTSKLLQLSVTDDLAAVGWQLGGMGRPTSLYWSDMDGDGLPEIAVGNRDGNVLLFKIRSNNESLALASLDVGSSVLALTALERASERRSDLLAITENGLVQLFRAQENWPPLLTSPAAEVTQNQYSLVISVQDVENDDVKLRLEIQDPVSGLWQAGETKELSGGQGTLFWLVENSPAADAGLRYRFHYDDGFHQGFVTPPPGPVVAAASPASLITPAGLGLLGVIALVVTFVAVRQGQSPANRARRFYRELTQKPAESLTMLESKYAVTIGSPDFLLSLANQARQRKNSHIAGLADGLFLLTDQPRAGLPIIQNALQQVAEKDPDWHDLDRWQMLFKMGKALLEAPTVTELALLRPQLLQMLNTLEEQDLWSPIFDALLPVMTYLRDSERVELAADRIIYLNEAESLLKQLWDHLPEFSVRIEKTLVTAVVHRWSALVGAEIEDLRGRAELAITLKTRRLAPVKETTVVLEIQNNGRAAAENLIAELDSDPAYLVGSSPQEIRLLPPGRTVQINFTIEPQVSDRFRLAMKVTYDDRNRRDKAVAFGDMVHLLPPTEGFKPIPNPYLPGTPLRRNSPVFYGRQELFDFIAENAGDLTQRNVLILVGERRTGKTSVLLRLEQHLPHQLVPVYIDCQSLGVIPGMPALLHDLSWYVADALANRGIMVEVPEPGEWQADPTGKFQRQFLPQAQAKLPPGTTLMLVFDEFEAFENLVDDGILPPTLFTYLRHLMQHSEGLSFVFVGTRRLEEMSADYWSVLFNIALYRKIGYLSDESATQLICEPVKPSLYYDDLALDKILRVTTGHPYFLQLVCYTLVKRANSQRSGYATISDVNAALDEMLRLGEVHFAYLWQRSTHPERALLTAMAHMMDRDEPFHPADLVRYLKPYGIHLSPAAVTTALNQLVERSILSEVAEGAITRYELKIGLVGLWVARYKSLSRLLTDNGDALPDAVRSAA